MYPYHELEQFAKTRQAEWEHVIQERKVREQVQRNRHSNGRLARLAGVRRMFAKAGNARPSVRKEESGGDPFPPRNAPDVGRGYEAAT